MQIKIKENFIGERIDVVIPKILLDISRAKVQKYIKEGVVRCGAEEVRDCAWKVREACEIELNIEEYTDDNDYKIEAEELNLDVIFEDEHIIIIDKPCGIVCHPAPGHKTGTIVNALVHKFENFANVGDKSRPGIVHRLDKDTSGLMLIAKTDAAHRAFSDMFACEKGKTLKREYACFVFGCPKERCGKIETFLTRHQRLRQQYTVSETTGKKALTLYNTERSFYFSSTKAISKINCELLTGRTHQIRIHMKYLGTHVIGDQVYGKQKIEEIYPKFIRNLKRQALHSRRLSFIHPMTGENLSFESDLPEDLKIIDKIITNSP
ncbi:pseudouridine synthase [Alphaproteobacteria bacterium]|nr:pseudouridine synthase [Alphaproteobacteria bacterium]